MGGPPARARADAHEAARRRGLRVSHADRARAERAACSEVGGPAEGCHGAEVRLKPDATEVDLVRLKPDATEVDLVRLKPDATEVDLVRLKPDATEVDLVTAKARHHRSGAGHRVQGLWHRERSRRGVLQTVRDEDRGMKRFTTLVALALFTGALACPLQAQPPAAGAQMPDARQMSGIPLPVSDLAVGTVTVRVVRGAMTNPVVDQSVELSGGSSPMTARTNESGRAEFTGLRPGTKVTAIDHGRRRASRVAGVQRAGHRRGSRGARRDGRADGAARGRTSAAGPAAGTIFTGGAPPRGPASSCSASDRAS